MRWVKAAMKAEVLIYCSGWEDRTPFADLRTRLQADPEWQVHDLPTAHSAMREGSEAVAALLLDNRTVLGEEGEAVAVY